MKMPPLRLSKEEGGRGAELTAAATDSRVSLSRKIDVFPVARLRPTGGAIIFPYGGGGGRKGKHVVFPPPLPLHSFDVVHASMYARPSSPFLGKVFPFSRTTGGFHSRLPHWSGGGPGRGRYYVSCIHGHRVPPPPSWANTEAAAMPPFDVGCHSPTLGSFPRRERGGAGQGRRVGRRRMRVLFSPYLATSGQRTHSSFAV